MRIETLTDLELENIEKTDQELTIKLTNGRIIKFDAVGDCCSTSYIEDFDNPEALKNALLIKVESESGPMKEDDDEYHVSKWTFYKFTTTKGMCTLSFRNDSNGYYDGNLEFVSDTGTPLTAQEGER